MVDFISVLTKLCLIFPFKKKNSYERLGIVVSNQPIIETCISKSWGDEHKVISKPDQIKPAARAL